jgi:hypothetical protein
LYLIPPEYTGCGIAGYWTFRRYSGIDFNALTLLLVNKVFSN